MENRRRDAKYGKPVPNAMVDTSELADKVRPGATLKRSLPRLTRTLVGTSFSLHAVILPPSRCSREGEVSRNHFTVKHFVLAVRGASVQLHIDKQLRRCFRYNPRLGLRLHPTLPHGRVSISLLYVSTFTTQTVLQTAGVAAGARGAHDEHDDSGDDDAHAHAPLACPGSGTQSPQAAEGRRTPQQPARGTSMPRGTPARRPGRRSPETRPGTREAGRRSSVRSP